MHEIEQMAVSSVGVFGLIMTYFGILEQETKKIAGGAVHASCIQLLLAKASMTIYCTPRQKQKSGFQNIPETI